MSCLLLKLAVIPVGASLLDGDSVSERFPGSDPRKAETGNSIHIGGRPDAMPMNRGRHLQTIGDRYRYCPAFAPSEQLPRNRTGLMHFERHLETALQPGARRGDEYGD